MRIIEPHIHTISRTTGDYYDMAVSGIIACVEPSFWTGTDRSSVSSFQDYWEHMITHETERAKQYGIRHYVMVGLNPKEARVKIARDVLKAMEEYLDRKPVVGIGEIGLDQITKEEEEIFRVQLRMAKSKNLPVTVHLPHQNKKKGAERTVAILEEEEVDPSKVIIDHNTEETIELSLSSRCWAGMTVYYVTKLSAERAVAMIMRYGTERVIVNGSADWGHSDPLAVPKVAMTMRKEGFSEEAVNRVVFENPYSFLKQSPNFDLEQ